MSHGARNAFAVIGIGVLIWWLIVLLWHLTRMLIIVLAWLVAILVVLSIWTGRGASRVLAWAYIRLREYWRSRSATPHEPVH